MPLSCLEKNPVGKIGGVQVDLNAWLALTDIEDRLLVFG